MWDGSTALELVFQANKLHQEGNTVEALQLMDEAIQLAEKANSTEHALQWKTHRALLEADRSRDFSALISASQEALDFYAQQNNPVEQLGLLINLAGLMLKMGNKTAASQYLANAENLLSALSPSELSGLSPVRKGAAVSPEMFLEFQHAAIERIRRQITGETQ